MTSVDLESKGKLVNLKILKLEFQALCFVFFKQRLIFLLLTKGLLRKLFAVETLKYILSLILENT